MDFVDWIRRESDLFCATAEAADPRLGDQREHSGVTRRLEARFERLGYRVQLEPVTSAASRRQMNISDQMPGPDRAAVG